MSEAQRVPTYKDVTIKVLELDEPLSRFPQVRALILMAQAAVTARQRKRKVAST